MEKTKEEFITFIRQAINDNKSRASEELYQFLVACYVRADVGRDGKIYSDMFDTLVEEAADLPRRYGYAPKTEAMYPSATLRRSGRAALFASMDTEKTGYITLDNWITFATKHIAGKVQQLPKDYLGGTSTNVSKNEFIDFMRQAVNKGTPEYQELYFFLLKNFQSGDVNKVGLVDPIAFDLMIEDAAAAPRRFGLAPNSKDMYKTDADRLNTRKRFFATMDTDGNGTISFDEWLNYALEHIRNKVATLSKK